jgi:hypothetical protein
MRFDSASTRDRDGAFMPANEGAASVVSEGGFLIGMTPPALGPVGNPGPRAAFAPRFSASAAAAFVSVSVAMADSKSEAKAVVRMGSGTVDC